MKILKRYLIIFLLFLSLLASAQPKYEVRAVWLTTIGGIDWPSSYAHNGMGIERQKQQLIRMLDQLKAANVNTVLLQTRIRATTLYPSDIEPWDGCLSGKPGVSPGYDALQFAIDECHKRGIELHAWVVTIPVGKWNGYGCQKLRRRYPSLIRKIGDEGYMNPESSQTAEYIANICSEITRRYDIDGIHLDYIRYPETWRGSKQRQNITRIVRTIYQKTKVLKPWIKLSCSPIGKYDDLSRYSSRGWNANRQVAQDAQGWLRSGLMDQLYPMMYFRGNNFYPFAIDWQENNYGRTVVSGLGIYMLHPLEGNWPVNEVKRQFNVTRSIGMGHCYFRAKFLLDNVKGIYNIAKDFDRHPALIPPMKWEQSRAPLPPTTLTVKRTGGGDQISWSGARDLSNGPYLLYNIYASTELPIDITNPANLVATRTTSCNVTMKRPGNKRPLYYAVTALDRYGNESPAVMQQTAGQNNAVASYLLPNDGKKLTLDYSVDAELLVVRTLQGTVVKNFINSKQINIAGLPEGFYELKSLNRKGISHRLGFFVIRR